MKRVFKNFKNSKFGQALAVILSSAVSLFSLCFLLVLLMPNRQTVKGRAATPSLTPAVVKITPLPTKAQ